MQRRTRITSIQYIFTYELCMVEILINTDDCVDCLYLHRNYTSAKYVYAYVHFNTHVQFRIFLLVLCMMNSQFINSVFSIRTSKLFCYIIHETPRTKQRFHAIQLSIRKFTIASYYAQSLIINSIPSSRFQDTPNGYKHSN